MQAIELTGPGQLRVSEHPVPATPKDGVLLKTNAVSICSTDISYFHGNLYPRVYPVILGHEYAGTVVDVGDEADNALLGQRIAYFGQTDFGGMAEFRALRPLFAGDMRTSPFSTDRYFKDDDRAAAVLLTGDILDREAPLLEPITAVLRAILTHPPAIGNRVLILGGGPCGAIAGSILQSLYGTRSVALLEQNPVRRAVGASQYAQITFASAADLRASAFDDDAFDYIFDALPPLIDQDPETCPRRAAMRAAKPGSKYVLYGASQVLQQFDTWLLLAKGITLSSAAFDVGYFPMHKTAHVMRTARELLSRRIVDPSWMITQEMQFKRPDDVFELFETYRQVTSLKTVVRFDN